MFPQALGRTVSKFLENENFQIITHKESRRAYRLRRQERAGVCKELPGLKRGDNGQRGLPGGSFLVDGAEGKEVQGFQGENIYLLV